MQLLATNQVYPNKDNPRNVNEAKFVNKISQKC